MQVSRSVPCFRRLTLAALAASVAVFAAEATEGSAKLEFSTVSPGGKYGPKHVLAVWVTDARTNLVKTICRYGNKRQKHLVAWNETRGGDNAVDGVTGATRSSHDELSVTWNGRDAANKPLPDGTYLFFVEFTESNRQGPALVLPIAKGPKPESKTFPDQPGFKKIRATFAPAEKSEGSQP